ncbi:MAG TPA: 8-amino-7-oxononanoate synthase [Solirubrobacteraceae bacterium]|nr:8-amino-7-oxononanoate synthase [Solirubrobacteraceae bacterium]
MTDVTATLAALEHAGLLRRPVTLGGGGGGGGGGRAEIDGREVIVLCSNDYLGLREHPAVRQAAADAAMRWGAGAGSSRLVAGSLELHGTLERELCDFKGSEACVLFGSGYLANTGVIAALSGRGEVVLSDSLNHASIVDGCRLSRAETVVYPHGDMDALGWNLERVRGRPALIVTDSVFSMDGDVAPLAAITDLARRHGARVVVDEAHATGVLGPGGRGLVAELGLEEEVHVVIGTLSKALGSYGAFACCRRPVADYLINRARTLIFSTALPPASVAAGLAAVRLVREAPELVARVRQNARVMRGALLAQGLVVRPGAHPDVPVLPIVVGAPAEAVRQSQAALKAGVFVQAIRPPTVPEGTSRLRVTVSAAHAADDLLRAAAVLAAAAH